MTDKNKKAILHELGFRKALEDNKNKLYSKRIDLSQLASEFQAGLVEEAKKQNQNNQEVIVNEYE